MPAATVLQSFAVGPLGTGMCVCVYCGTAVTIATGPLQLHGTDNIGPMVNPQVCAVV